MARPVHSELSMMDTLYVGITIVFFAVSLAYVVGCDRL